MAALLVDDLPSAEDVVQDAFIAFHRTAGQLHDPDACGSSSHSTAAPAGAAGRSGRLDEIQQPDGIDRPTREEIARIAMKNPDPSRYDIGAMSFARVSAAGRLEPLAVPEELRQSGWSLKAGTPDGFLVEHATGHRDSIDAAASWNPLTGQVRYLFHQGGSKASPRENLAAWHTSQL